MVIFLIWFWLINVALRFGIELDAEIERTTELKEGVPPGRPRRGRLHDQGALRWRVRRPQPGRPGQGRYEALCGSPEIVVAPGRRGPFRVGPVQCPLAGSRARPHWLVNLLGPSSPGGRATSLLVPVATRWRSRTTGCPVANRAIGGHFVLSRLRAPTAAATRPRLSNCAGRDSTSGGGPLHDKGDLTVRFSHLN